VTSAPQNEQQRICAQRESSQNRSSSSRAEETNARGEVKKVVLKDEEVILVPNGNRNG
jgi:hypothetical protein